jgi:hypothetical protein
VFLQPALAFFVSVEIVENDVEFAIREVGHDMIHESEKLHTVPPLRMLGNDLPGGNFQPPAPTAASAPLGLNLAEVAKEH